MLKRDNNILKHIIEYADQIEDANKQFGSVKETFVSNSVYKNAVAMCVLQIGELTNCLSEEFKVETSIEIPWKQIRGLRNVVAHQYGKLDDEILWETITEDIPMLRKFCEEQLKKLI